VSTRQSWAPPGNSATCSLCSALGTSLLGKSSTPFFQPPNSRLSPLINAMYRDDSGLRDSKSQVFHLQTPISKWTDLCHLSSLIISRSRDSGLRDSKSRVFHLQTYESPICEMDRSLPPVLQHGRSRCLRDFWDVVEFTLLPK
jgi:hypothetical protein